MNGRNRNESELFSRSGRTPARIEVLEPRVLLASELIAGIGEVNLRPIHLPGDKIEVPVTIQNVSATQISGKIRVQIWASNEDFLDASDYLCFDGDISINPRANLIQTKKVKATLPLHIVPDEYQFIVFVSEAQSMLPAGVTFAEPVDDDDETFDLRWLFGDVEGRNGNTTLRFMNEEGVIYKISFSDGFDGNERGEVFNTLFAGAQQRGAPTQPLSLVFFNTTDDDRISVRRAGGPTDPELFYLNGIFTNFGGREERGGFGALAFFDASDLTLYGPSHFAGLKKLFLGNVIDAEIVTINFGFAGLLESGASEVRGGEEFSPLERVSIKVKTVVDTLFDVNQTIANFKADSFVHQLVRSDDRSDPLGGIFARFIDKVDIRNDYRGVVFVSGVHLAREMNGLEVPENAVNEFKVGGDLSGAFFVQDGDVARLQAGSIGNFEASISGRLERLVVEGNVNVPGRGGPDRFLDPTVIGARQISRIDIGGSTFDTIIMAGAVVESLSGAFLSGEMYQGLQNVDFDAGIIGRVNIGGTLMLSQIAAGVDADGSDNFSDTSILIGDRSVSRIGPINVGGVDANSGFFSGDFPDTAKIDGSTVVTVDEPTIFVVVFPTI